MSCHNCHDRKEDNSVRLPKDVKPLRYDLHVVPDLVACTFQGHVSIEVEVMTATNVVVMHSLELSYPRVDRINIVAKQGGASRVCRLLSVDQEEQRLILDFKNKDGEALQPGHYILNIPYAGILNDKLAGFYRSKYTALDGSSKFMGVTQFEATDARRALPCWDEPAIKAVFSVTLSAPKDLTVVSNMPIKTCRTVDHEVQNQTLVERDVSVPVGHFTYHFQDSPIMSTYLLAWVVGEFDFLSGCTKGGVEVRIFTPLGKVAQGEFSLKVATGALDFYDHYFGIKYPLPKVDLLAIPDFAAGAMENWGCITYRDTRLLIDAVNSAASSKQAVARTVCHELAHMWFGNLVTMEFWTHLWLNEGFARFMEHKAVDHLFPEWDIWTQFVAGVCGAAFSLDALQTSHPIEVEVHHPSEISSIFDSISYAKGASVIRMLHEAMGGEVFMQGIRHYLQKWKYQNAKTEDLWASLSEASGMDVEAFMSAWIKQMGYPVLTVRKREGKVLSLHQERFLSTGAKEQGEQKLWFMKLPVVAVGEEKAKAGADLKPRLVDFNRECGEVDVGCEGAVTLNFNQAGFFRVHYTPEMFASLGEAGSSGRLPAVDRLALLSDAFALGKAGRLPVTQALDLLPYYKDEQDYSVVEVVRGELGALCALHAEQPYFPLLQRLVGEVFAPMWARLGWQPKAGEDHVSSLLRACVLAMMGLSGDGAVTEEAVRRLLSFAADPKANNIPADLRSAVYSIAAKKGGVQAYDALVGLYRGTQLAEEKSRVLAVLGRAKEPALLQRTLDFAVSAEVRKQDSHTIFSSLASTAAGRDLAWNYLKNNWAHIEREYAGMGFVFSYVIGAVCGSFSSNEKADEIEEFFKKNPCPPVERTLRQSLESVRSKANRVANQKNMMDQWLNKRYQA